MAANKDIWVFSEKPVLLFELIAAARSLAGSQDQVVAFVIGARSTAEQAVARGADRAVWAGELREGQLLDAFVPTLAKSVKESQPALVLVGSTRRGKAIAGRLAARLGTSVLTDVLEFQKSDSAIEVRRMIFGGGAVRAERAAAGVVLATVAAGVFEAALADASRTGPIEEAAFVEPDWQAKLRQRMPLPKASVHLDAARRVVTAGRGLASQDDLKLVESLARLLGAEVACTRPLAEGLGWLPVERYIGISGATVKPDLYLGVGVSGQVQHMIGMYGSRVVVAINKDANAPIFAQADYGIVADLYSILPVLIAALEKRG